MRAKIKTYHVLTISVPLFLAILLWSATSGAYPIAMEQLFGQLLYKMGLRDTSALDTLSYAVFTSIRLPRIVLALLVGGSLALAGAALQGLFRNPLADPGLIGVSTGASSFAAASIVLGVSSWFNHSLLSGLTMNLFTFIGAAGFTFLALWIARTRKNTDLTSLLLAGIALNALGGSLTALLTFISDNEQLRNISFWLMGSLGGASWTNVAITLFLAIPAWLYLLRKHRLFNALSLGEEHAGYLGFRVKREKRMIILFAALLVAVCVSFTGIIGFVGLVIPHLIRLMVGANHRTLIPYSLFFGSTFLLIADTLSRTLIEPKELPIGILTSLTGAPFFLYLIVKQKSQHTA
jgi:iron complex transport system permease protein